MSPMSASKSKPPLPRGPRNAIDALLADVAGDPIRRALRLDALDHLLRPHLPPSLAAHARLANLRDGRLVYLVDSPLWHAKLRLAAPELLQAARSLGLDASDIVVRTSTRPLYPSAPAASVATPLSAAASEGLRSALASLRSPNERDGGDTS
ncbi:MAG: DUF721 domain-containing protein [Pseudomonadota bacterium]|nr:DUF721 domain-containing protein [Pseudomonadota bacterium]